MRCDDSEPARRYSLIEGDWCTKRVLVVGDVMVDRYIWGHMERISPEAPAPVVHVAQHSQRSGAAANVAMNVAGLGAKAIGFSGNDDTGKGLEYCLQATGVVPYLRRFSSHPTTTKLRILSGKQQMLRLDTEQSTGDPREVGDSLITALEAALADADAVALSDYAKGCLSKEICQRIIAAARSLEIPVLVDPKVAGLYALSGSEDHLPKPEELSAVVGIPVKEPEALLAAG